MIIADDKKVQEFQVNNPTIIAGMSDWAVRINLAEGSSGVILGYLRSEFHFAEEDQLSLSKHLNHFNFQQADFQPTDSEHDLVLAAGIINYGLSVGLSFCFLVENITTLLAGVPDFKTPLKLGLDDSHLIKDVRAAALFCTISIEFREYALKLCSETLESFDQELDSGLKLACFSALASFLTKEKQVLRKQDKITTELLSPSPALSPEKLLLSPNLDLIDQQTRVLALEVNRFTNAILDTDGKYHEQLLPSALERQQAVDFFLHNPEKLQRLYNNAFEQLSAGLEAKHPHGYPDHDRRHILFSVPVSALQLGAERDSYDQCFGTFCALLHDAGRIVEATYPLSDPRKSQISKIHPQISTAIAANLLEEFPEIPVKVRNEILIAIATHDNLSLLNSPLARFVASCDRLQLIGPEFFLRNLYLVSCNGFDFYPNLNEEPKRNGSVLGSVAFYLHHLLPNIGSHYDFETRLRVCSGTILKLAAYGNEECGECFFPQSFLVSSSWKVLPHLQRREIERSAFKAGNGHSIEWPQYQGRFMERNLPNLLGFFDELLSLPLVSQPDFDSNGVSGRERLNVAIGKALEFNPYFFDACQYASSIAACYHREQLWTLARACSSSSLPIKLFADGIASYTRVLHAS